MGSEIKILIFYDYHPTHSALIYYQTQY